MVIASRHSWLQRVCQSRVTRVCSILHPSQLHMRLREGANFHESQVCPRTRVSLGQEHTSFSRYLQVKGKNKRLGCSSHRPHRPRVTHSSSTNEQYNPCIIFFFRTKPLRLPASSPPSRFLGSSFLRSATQHPTSSFHWEAQQCLSPSTATRLPRRRTTATRKTGPPRVQLSTLSAEE